MATAKASKSKKTSKKSKKSKDVETEAPSKKSKKNKKDKKEKSGKKSSSKALDKITKEYDDYVIIRKIKENPRKAGSKKAKIWDKLKKGMTVAEFVEKGGSRSIVRFYIQNGWVKIATA